MTREEAKTRIIAMKAKFEVLLSMRGLEMSDVFDVAIEALSAEPCEDAISRQAVLDDLEKSHMTSGVRNQSTWNECIDSMMHTIRDMPPVTPKQKMGHWVNGEYCSECGCDVPVYAIDWKWQKDMNAKYCPNCGARMESGGE